jgi:hypothetical protein
LGTRSNRFRGQNKLKRNRYIFGAAILVLLVTIVVGAMRLNSDALESQELADDEGQVAGLQTSFEDIQTQITTTSSTPTNKSTYLAQLDALEREILLYQDDTLQPEVLESLLNQIAVQKDTLLSRERFVQPEIVADIGSVHADANLTDLEYASGNLFITDSARGVVYKTGIQLNSTIAEHLTGLTTPFLLEQNIGGEVVLYDNDASSSIGRFDPNTPESLSRYVGLPKTEIGSVKEVSIYSGNNALYEINVTHGQIFKRADIGGDYLGGGSLYTSVNPPNWKTDQALKSAIDIEAPFEIYALIDGVGLQRYLGGGENTLPADSSSYLNTSTEDIASIANATALAVNGEYVVIGDSTNQRVLLFKIVENGTGNKPLEFVKQFVYDGDQSIFQNINEVIVEGSQIFVLDGKRVIRLGI